VAQYGSADAGASLDDILGAALEKQEEKEAVAQYGSADAGASLGDILSATLKKQEEK